MSTFADTFASYAAPELRDHFGEVITVSAESVTAIVTVEPRTEADQRDGILETQRISVTTAADDWDPSRGDAFTWSSETWTVESALVQNGQRLVSAKRYVNVEKSGDGYRIRRP